ncbi:hypothetical protein RHGRI_009808 [Rhododendron griersonianum]|uniref:SKP1-like protein n=1 Tax=Rhododendron griersonianum TaxID=479676 RepID=A0AAV6KG63_9ERIC|nr:hypothetical protein RHGRI_009808 [Rhododendron griersonianum]
MIVLGANMGPKPRREWVAGLVSRNDNAVRSLPIHVGSVSLLAVLINRIVSTIPPDASRCHELRRSKAVALQSQTIKHMIEDDCADTGIPLPNVTSGVLSKVIEYCKKHAESPGPNDDDRAGNDALKTFDAKFIDVDQGLLFDLILAANYLDIKSLLDLTCQTVADMIKGKTPEEVRKIFNIVNDFTPEEEDEVRRENA